jgi:hypothetical protein
MFECVDDLGPEKCIEMAKCSRGATNKRALPRGTAMAADA